MYVCALHGVQSDRSGRAKGPKEPNDTNETALNSPKNGDSSSNKLYVIRQCKRVADRQLVWHSTLARIHSALGRLVVREQRAESSLAKSKRGEKKKKKDKRTDCQNRLSMGLNVIFILVLTRNAYTPRRTPSLLGRIDLD